MKVDEKIIQSIIRRYRSGEKLRISQGNIRSAEVRYIGGYLQELKEKLNLLQKYLNVIFMQCSWN